MSDSQGDESMEYQEQSVYQSLDNPDEVVGQRPSAPYGPADSACPVPWQEVKVTLSLKWTNSQRPSRLQTGVQRILQSWFNKCSGGTNCSVEEIYSEERVLIKLNPAPGLALLQELCGQTLKDKKSEAAATVSCICLTPSAPSEEDAATPLSETHLQRQKPPGAEGQPEPGLDSAPAENDPFGIIPASQYWYLTQVHMDTINEIMQINGVEMEENLKVSFKTVTKDGNPQKALFDFISFIQSVQFSSAHVPVKFVDPDTWNDALKFAKSKDTKLLLSLTPETITILGPTKSCDALSKVLNANPEQHTPFPVNSFERAPQDASPTIAMTISDPLVETGVIIEENTWKLMKISFIEKIENIQDKFNVSLKETFTDPGKVIVRASSKRAVGDASMESHAIRALLRLYQKIVTSPMNSNRSLKTANGGDESVGSREDLGSPRRSEAAASWEAPSGAAGLREDNCPICRDKLTDKIQLKCTHEFCTECLRQAKESMGPVCPVCRDVFGMMEGDQPKGTMTPSIIHSDLPGFRGWGTIKIVYKIPGGVQTKKHPNPGQCYTGISREAYLPNNKEGQEVLSLLRKAFDQKLIFTVGTSITTGMGNAVTWNDIHHKTSRTGGPEGYGYPDPDYLRRVKEELKAKGIK